MDNVTLSVTWQINLGYLLALCQIFTAPQSRSEPGELHIPPTAISVLWLNSSHLAQATLRNTSKFIWTCQCCLGRALSVVSYFSVVSLREGLSPLWVEDSWPFCANKAWKMLKPITVIKDEYYWKLFNTLMIKAIFFFQVITTKNFLLWYF